MINNVPLKPIKMKCWLAIHATPFPHASETLQILLAIYVLTFYMINQWIVNVCRMTHILALVPQALFLCCAIVRRRYTIQACATLQRFFCQHVQDSRPCYFCSNYCWRGIGVFRRDVRRSCCWVAAIPTRAVIAVVYIAGTCGTSRETSFCFCHLLVVIRLVSERVRWNRWGLWRWTRGNIRVGIRICRQGFVGMLAIRLTWSWK